MNTFIHKHTLVYRMFFGILLLMAYISNAFANDGVYFMSGNFLVPVKETDISVQKEILTITIGADKYAKVDVYYEFLNKGQDKTVTMAFEADSPYNAGEAFQRNGKHPNIKDFTVWMNDASISYNNKVIAIRFGENGREVDYTPLDLSKWKSYGEVPDSLLPVDMELYNTELDSTSAFGYGYFFQANFKHGLNKVHHTYSFLMSYNVTEKFNIPYWLTPATRWANHQVDDFTLRIKSENPAQSFCMADTIFSASPFKISEGNGRIYQMKVSSGEHYLYAELGPNAVLEWHAKNFSPESDMSINDSERILNTYSNSVPVVIDKEGQEYRLIGDCGNTYLVSSQDIAEIPKVGCKVEEYTPDKGKGWIHPTHTGKYNVRQQPTTKSTIIGTLQSIEGELPDVTRCLGYVQKKEGNLWYWWYKVEVNGKTGYIRGDLVEWDAINTY